MFRDTQEEHMFFEPFSYPSNVVFSQPAWRKDGQAVLAPVEDPSGTVCSILVE
jgi:hypothetical protein